MGVYVFQSKLICIPVQNNQPGEDTGSDRVQISPGFRSIQSTLVNHALAHMFLDHVDRFIQKEVGFGAMLGLLDYKHFDIHIYPFMTRKKIGFELKKDKYGLKLSLRFVT